MARAAGIYTRISDDREGTHLGVDRQRADCEALAAKLGWPVAGYYEDNDLSAYSGKPRPEYRRMLSDLQAGRIDAILAWHPDRLSRSPRELEELIDLAEASGAEIQTATAGSFDLATPTGRAVARTVGAWARYESEHKAERIRRQKLQLALDGRPAFGGPRPFGYARDLVTVVPDEAAVITEMKDRVLAGDSIRSLATNLNARGFRTSTGREWYQSAIRDLLLRPRYSGQREYRGEVVATATWPAIFSTTDAARLAAILRDPRRRTNRTVRRYLLSGGLLRCASCGTPLVARPLHGVRRYVCAKGPGLPGCGQTCVVAIDIEQFLVDAVLARLTSPHLAAALSGASDDTDTAHALREIEEDEALLNQLADLFGRKEIRRQEWNSAKAPIAGRLAANRNLLSARTRSRAVDGLLATPDGIQAAYGRLTLQQQHAVIAAVLDHAMVSRGPRGSSRFEPGRGEPRAGGRGGPPHGAPEPPLSQ
jgi:site-specific DNA recombinase